MHRFYLPPDLVSEGEITLDELGKFLRELFKEQIKELQEGVEKQKYSRAVKDFKDDLEGN